MATPEQQQQPPPAGGAPPPPSGGSGKGMMIAAVVVVLLIVVAAAAFLLYKPAPTTTGDPCPDGKIPVGVLLTQTGALATDGKKMVNGAKLKADEINAAGGVTVGDKKCTIKYIIEDDELDATKAKAKATKLVETDKVQVIIGDTGSSVCLAIDEVTSVAKVPIISPSCTSPKLSERPWIFRTVPSDAYQGVAMIDLHKAMKAGGWGVNKIAVYSINNAYGAGIHKVIVDTAAAQSIEVVFQQTYAETGTNYEADLTALKAKKPAGENLSVLLTTYEEQGQAIFQSVSKLGMTPANGYKWVSNDGIVGSAWLADPAKEDPVAKAAAQGMLGTNPSTPPALQGQATYKAFVDAYTKAYNEPPSSYAATAYDAMGAAMAATTNAKEYKGEKIKAELNKFTGGAAYIGVTGKKAFDSNGDIGVEGAYYNIYQVTGNEFKASPAFWDGVESSKGVQGFNLKP